MNVDAARLDDGSLGRRRRRGQIAAVTVAATMGLALAAASSAWASVSATVAPIGSPSAGSFLVTVTNSGPETEGVIVIGPSGTGVVASSIVPTTCQYNQPIAGAIGCPKVAAAGSLQVCYTGPVAGQVLNFGAASPTVPLTSVPTVASCPVPGFTPASTSTPVPVPTIPVPPIAIPALPPRSGPAKCKKGFVRKTEHGKAKCVKRKKHKH
jgi:hypothetical protein